MMPKAKKLVERRSGEWTPGLTEDEKQTLFAMARDTLLWSVGGRKGSFDFGRYTLTPRLKGKSATFVTFKNKDDLRGCVGCLQAREAMYLSVHTSADSAAHDSRFEGNPISSGEIPEIEIHVSILSAMKPIPSLSEFKIGEHGILIQKGYRSAVYLPEVAVEQRWTQEETLSHLSQKANLAPDAWQQGASFMVFSSVVIAEE
jgi:hypothetical protein